MPRRLAPHISASFTVTDAAAHDKLRDMRTALPQLFFGTALVASLALAHEAAADCTCRAAGRDFDLGRSICMATPTGFRFATCDMVLNNTSWRISSTPCVVASADEAPPAAPGSQAVRSHRH